MGVVVPNLDISHFLRYKYFVRNLKILHSGEINMRTVITSKYQTTIPKAIRESAGLSKSDTLEWKIEKGKIVIVPIKKNFLKFRNALKVGRGDIKADIRLARELRAEKLR